MSKYFIDTQIYFQGKRMPPRKVPIKIDVEDEKEIHCYDEDGNFYSIPKEKIYDDNDNPIKDARNRLHMTQSEFAKFLNMPKRTLEDWESGKSKPAKYVISMIIEKVFALVDLKEGV